MMRRRSAVGPLAEAQLRLILPIGALPHAALESFGLYATRTTSIVLGKRRPRAGKPLPARCAGTTARIAIEKNAQLLPQKIVDDALKRDPAAARAEWFGEWRDDIAAFLSRELIEAAVSRGVTVRPPQAGLDYHAFADPSGGLGDAYTAAVAHREADGSCVLDCLHDASQSLE
jgi:hypothetical protein